MVVAADTTDAAGDEMRITWVLALHKEAVPSEDGRGAVALRHPPVPEVDFGVDSQAANNTSNRVPRHFYKLWRLGWSLFSPHLCSHNASSLLKRIAVRRCRR